MKLTLRTAALLLAVLLLSPLVSGVSLAASDLPYAVGAEALEETPVRKIARFAAVEMQTGMQLDSLAADAPFAPTGGMHALMVAYIAAKELTLEKRIKDEVGFSDLSESLPNAGLERGDEAAVSDLVTAAVLCSAQDAALMLARAVTADKAAFVEKMNQYAAELGMTNTKYTQIAGSIDAEEYTTCADLLRLARAAAALPGMTELVSAYTTAPDTAGNHLPKTLTASLRLLSSESSKYEARIKALFGGAYPKASTGYGAIFLVEIGGMQVLCVLNTTEERDDAFSPIVGVLDYLEKGFGYADCTAAIKKLLEKVEQNGIELTCDLSDTSATVIKKQESVINPLDFGYTLGEPSGEAIVGEVYASAAVTLGTLPVAEVPMRIVSIENAPAAPAADGTKTGAPTATPKPTPRPTLTFEPYTPEDELYQPSLSERFGWVLWVALAVLGSAAIIALGSVLTKWRR